MNKTQEDFIKAGLILLLTMLFLSHFIELMLAKQGLIA